MKRLYVFILAGLVAGALLFGWGYRRGAASAEVVESVRTVSVYYENPEPVRTARTTVQVNVPRMLFAPADTVHETLIVKVGKDSVEMRFDMEWQEYGGRDTTFYAVVSGPAVGKFRPRLERLELYAAERIQTNFICKPFRWEVGPAVGVWHAQAGRGIWLGGQARCNIGRLTLSAQAGYDFRSGGAFTQAQAAIAVWRK